MDFSIFYYFLHGLIATSGKSYFLSWSTSNLGK